MNKNGKRKFGKSVLMCGMSGVMAFGMVFAPVSMGASGGATQVKAATTTASIGNSFESVGGITSSAVALDGFFYVGYQKKPTSKTTTKTTTKTKKSSLSKNYKNKLTKKSTKTVTSTRNEHKSAAKVYTKVVTVTTVTKVYYKKTLTTTTTVKTTTTVTTTDYKRSGSPNINNYSRGLSGIVNSFKKDGYSLVLNSGQSSDGVFSSSNKRISVKYNADYIILHELGHYVNRKCGNVADSTGFKNAFASEKAKYVTFDGLNSNYGKSSASEFFAECFRDYVYSSASRKQLKSKCPKAYSYVENAVQKANAETLGSL